MQKQTKNCLELKCMIFTGITWCCFWANFVVYLTGFEDFSICIQRKEEIFQTFTWIHAYLYSPVDSCRTWALCREEKLTLLLFFFKYIHIIFVMSVKNASPKPFVSQKQCLSAVINTRGNLSQSLLTPSRSSDLPVISCLYSTSPPANGICPCYSGKQAQYCGKCTLFSCIRSLKAAQRPSHEFPA